MNDLWAKLTRYLLTEPETKPFPRLAMSDLPKAARLIPGALDKLTAYNHQLEVWAGELKTLVFQDGIFRGGIVFGASSFVVGVVAGWALCRQCQKMVVEAHATRS